VISLVGKERHAVRRKPGGRPGWPHRRAWRRGLRPAGSGG